MTFNRLAPLALTCFLAAGCATVPQNRGGQGSECEEDEAATLAHLDEMGQVVVRASDRFASCEGDVAPSLADASVDLWTSATWECSNDVRVKVSDGFMGRSVSVVQGEVFDTVDLIKDGQMSVSGQEEQRALMLSATRRTGTISGMSSVSGKATTRVCSESPAVAARFDAVNESMRGLSHRVTAAFDSGNSE